MLRHTNMLHVRKTVLEHLRLFQHQAWLVLSLLLLQRAGDNAHITQMRLVERAHCSKCKCQACHAGQHLQLVVLTLCVTATLRISCIGTVSSTKTSTWLTLMQRVLDSALQVTERHSKCTSVPRLLNDWVTAGNEAFARAENKDATGGSLL